MADERRAGATAELQGQINATLRRRTGGVAFHEIGSCAMGSHSRRLLPRSPIEKLAPLCRPMALLVLTVAPDPGRAGLPRYMTEMSADQPRHGDGYATRIRIIAHIDTSCP
jgi:hypothetical protein